MMVHGESRNADWETEPPPSAIQAAEGGDPGWERGHLFLTPHIGSRVTEHVTRGPCPSSSSGNLRNTKED